MSHNSKNKAIVDSRLRLQSCWHQGCKWKNSQKLATSSWQLVANPGCQLARLLAWNTCASMVGCKFSTCTLCTISTLCTWCDRQTDKPIAILRPRMQPQDVRPEDTASHSQVSASSSIGSQKRKVARFKAKAEIPHEETWIRNRSNRN